MSADTQLAAQDEVAYVPDENLLSKVVAATRQTEPERAQELLRTLTEQALKGTVTYDRNLTITFNKAIAAIDEKMSTPACRHHASPDFPKLEGSWRGLQLPGQEHRDQRQPEDPRAQHLQAGPCQGPDQGGRVRPEPALQEDL